MNRLLRPIIQAIVLVCFWGTLCSANPAYYTEFASGTGYLGAHVFTDAGLFVRAFGDTSNASTNCATFCSNIATRTQIGVRIGQGPVFTAFLINATFGAFVDNTGGTPEVGIAEFSPLSFPVIATFNPAFQFYDLRRGIFLSGPGLSRPPDVIFNTTLGDFHLSSISARTTFAARVPEPSSFVMFGSGAGLIVLYFLRLSLRSHRTT